MKKYKLVFLTFFLIPILSYGQNQEISLFSKTLKYPNQITDYVYRFGYKYNLYQKFQIDINASEQHSFNHKYYPYSDGYFSRYSLSSNEYEEEANIKNFTSNEIFIGRQLGVKSNKFIQFNYGLDIRYKFNYSKTINYNELSISPLLICQLVRLRSEFGGSFSIFGYHWGEFDTYIDDNSFNEFMIISSGALYYKFILSENFAFYGNVETSLNVSNSDKKVRLGDSWFYGIGIEYRIPK